MNTVYCAYDLETGDLEPENGDLLTGCFLMLDENFKILEELNLKLKPEGRLPVANPKALETNNIDIKKAHRRSGNCCLRRGQRKIGKYAQKDI